MPGRRLLVSLVAVAGLAFAAGPSLAAPTLAQRLAGALALSHAETGSVAFDLTTGATIFSRNEALPLAPASNEKLLVTYATLTELGASYRIETDVLGRGDLVGTTWTGDLYLQGHGDPTLGHGGLAELARQVRAFGITRVTGRIIGDESYFDSRRTAPGWLSWFYITESPPLSALAVDRAWYVNHYTAAPALAAAILFRGALRRAGVSVGGTATTGLTAGDAFPLAAIESPTLAEILRFMDRESDNYTAEILLKHLGALESGHGTTSAGAASVRAILADHKIPLAGVRIVDGSGLSRLDRLTARTIALLLRAAWADPDVRGPFVGALAVAGRNGTLEHRMRAAPAWGNVFAKTGTTDIASALSGFVRQHFLFSVLENGHPVSVGAAQRAQDLFASVLAAQ
jgi:D-alanyl-D-alanine carboxypeptidase/D-alanyl-D-alanine-endopeptidase (penicillin-binding protein 4)